TGLARGARAGGDDDPARRERFHLVERDGVVPAHVERRAELAAVLHQVVGEGIVVVDDQNHSASARRTAWIIARALLTHSRCSASGSESATIPAPAWTNTRPPRKSAERIVIAVSMAPENAK